MGSKVYRAVVASPADPDTLSRIAFEAIWAGAPLSLRGARARTGWARRRLQAAVDQLLGAGRLELDESSIVGAHGVTLRSTAHRIRHDGVGTHTWCAFDAVGIPVALAIDAVVATNCPTCGSGLEIAIRAGVPDDRPFVTWMPFGPCENVIRDFYADANLFCSKEHVDDWRAAAGTPDGAALTLPEIAAQGRRVWSDVAGAAEPTGGVA